MYVEMAQLLLFYAAISKGVQTVCDKLHFHLFSKGDIL